MTMFLSIIIASIAAHFVNGWMESWDISIRTMLGLIVFIAVYMASTRYLKNLRD